MSYITISTQNQYRQIIALDPLLDAFIHYQFYCTVDWDNLTPLVKQVYRQLQCVMMFIGPVFDIDIHATVTGSKVCEHRPARTYSEYSQLIIYQ